MRTEQEIQDFLRNNNCEVLISFNDSLSKKTNQRLEQLRKDLKQYRLKELKK